MVAAIAILFAATGLVAQAEDAKKPERVLGAENGTYQTDVRPGAAAQVPMRNGCREVLSLAGTWTVVMDPQQVGLKERWYERPLASARAMALPGTLDDAGLGEPMQPSRFVLTRKAEYIGEAWYQREIDIPESWRGKRTGLLFERVMWESRVWLDGRLVGSQDSLTTPHTYECGELFTPGRHLITVRVDNRGRPGASCHGYGEDIQIRWNGMVGRLELTARDAVSVQSVQAYPDLGRKRIRAVALIANHTGVTAEGEVRFLVRRQGEDKPTAEKTAWFKAAGDVIRAEHFLDLGDGMQTWDEFTPALYDLVVSVGATAEGARLADDRSVVFGMREVGAQGTQLTLNGRTLFLRGTHDGGALPLDGRPPLTVEGWRRIYRICKEYGLNHVRYHSFCPPEPAFVAADEEGILLQAELPHWGSVKDDWAGTPFLRQEMERILEFYGNHPSFALMSMGNEHDGDWETLGAFVEHGKRTDPRHRYASTSNAYIRRGELPVNPGDEFATIMWGKEKNGLRPRIRYMERFMTQDEDVARDQDWRDILDGFTVPVLGHELGQWWVYPDFSEMAKYTGVLRPTTLEVQRDLAARHGTLAQNAAFHQASGALAVELYKEDIERQLRTPHLAGFQLLDLHDYSGQGCSLVGLLDAFWESKGIVKPEDFRRFCAPTVVLARIPKQEYESGETVRIPIEVAHYGAATLAQASASWRLTGDDGVVVAEGRLPARDIPVGGTTDLGVVTWELKGDKASCLTLEAGIPGAGQPNRWRLWAYPRQPAVTPAMAQVRVTRTLDDETIAFVSQGGRLLLVVDCSDQTTPVYFPDPVWNPSCGMDTCGAYIDHRHSALAAFPTASHSDWQWFNLLRHASGLVVNDAVPMPGMIAQAIDAPFWRGSPIILIGEVTLGKGAVVLTSLDLIDAVGKSPAARQLRHSLVAYLASDPCRPPVTVDARQLRTLVEGERFHAVSGPPADAQVVLDVSGAAQAPEDGYQQWKREHDRVAVATEAFSYGLRRWMERWQPPSPPESSWRRGDKHGWSMPNVYLDLQVPKGFTGVLHLHFRDQESGKRDGYAYACGRTCMVGRHGGPGKWLALTMDAEDTAAGTVQVLVRRRSFGDAWSTAPIIDRLVLTKP
jgi:hypothetical protein